MDTEHDGDRREFSWVVQLDDPAQYTPTPLEEPEEEEPEEAEALPTVPVRKSIDLRGFLGPVLMALAYISVVSGMRWWAGG